MPNHPLMTLDLTASHDAPERIETPLLALILGPDPQLDASLAPLDKSLGGALGRTLSRRDFRGGRDETLLVVGGETGVQRVLLVGRGPSALKHASARRASAVAARQAVKLGTGAMHVLLHGASEEELEAIALGVAAGSWEYPDLKTPPPEKDRRASLGKVTIVVENNDAARAAVERGVAIAHGQFVAKRLGQMPGNVCTPDTFVEVANDIAGRHGMTVTVLGRAEMEKEGMGSFLCVAQGTPEEPRLVTLEHRRGPVGQKPVVLIGKGLCFDTGGISIKRAAEM